MKRIAPDYYTGFRCIAGACRHSCCIGWEIDVDEAALTCWRAVPGAFGERLRAGIAYDGDRAFFRLGDGERCPFLNAENLCDLILTLGDDALCRICRLHPRFFNTVGNREEAGLGLACEAAAALVLERETPMRLVTMEEDDEALSQEERSLLTARDALLDAAQDRRLPVEAREENLLALTGAVLPPRGAWRGLFAGLERMDPAWDDTLARTDASEMPSGIPETAQEQLLCYCLYRHVIAASDPADFAARTAFAVLGSRFVRAVSRNMAEYLDTARAYSAEIEYSEDNTAALIAALTR